MTFGRGSEKRRPSYARTPRQNTMPQRNASGGSNLMQTRYLCSYHNFVNASYISSTQLEYSPKVQNGKLTASALCRFTGSNEFVAPIKI
jgi:hypothetical protein